MKLWMLDDADGEATFAGRKVTLTELAFLAYYYTQIGEFAKAEELIYGAAERLISESKDVQHFALWLWVLSEFTKASGDSKMFKEHEGLVLAAVDQIEHSWKQPQPHWLDSSKSGVYLSQLACCHAALQTANHIAFNDRAMQLMKTIRELVFAKYIKDGKVVSELGSDEIFGDITAAAVPFGMLGIEDRILIEALFQLEERLIGKGVRLSDNDTYFGGCERSDLTSLLAWYYSLKGDTAKAKSLLNRLDELEQEQGILYEVDPATVKEDIYAQYWLERSGGQYPQSLLGRIWYELAAESLKGNQQASGAAGAEEVRILHEPGGHDDPYVFKQYERIPRHPLDGEIVWVRMVTQPYHPSQTAYIAFRINDAEHTILPMCLEIAADGEKVWQACLGHFQFGDRVDYNFTVQQHGRKKVSSTYSFHTRSWIGLSQIRELRTGEGTLKVIFDEIAEIPSVPVLSINDEGESGLRCSFSLQDGVIQEKLEAMETGEARLGKVCVEAADIGASAALKWFGQSGLLLESYNQHWKAFLEVLADGTGAIHRLRFNFRMKPEDRMYGMGERFAQYQYRGHVVDNYVHNEYRDQKLRTYMPVPFAISSGGYGFYLNSPYYSSFRFGTTLTDLLEVETELDPLQPELEAYLFAGKPLEQIGMYTAVTGKPHLPPKWSFGPWMSSNNWDSQHEVNKQVEATLKYGIPATVIVLEQWSDEATFYIFNDARYEVADGEGHLRYEDFTFPDWGRWPDPKGMVDDLHDNGLKVLLWQIPIHKFMYGVPHGQRDADEAAMLKNGYQVKLQNGEPYVIPYNWFKDCHVIDFTNPEARDWWFGKRKYLLTDIGVDGFKTDGGECIFGHDALFHDGRSGLEMRNLYPNLYIGSYFDFVQRNVPGGGITFSRAGYSGAQRYPLHWAGDERSTYPAFRASLIAGLTSGMSGIPFWGWDLGGFHGDIPTAELFIRSTQMSAFCPVMQYHAETKGEFNQDRTPWNIAERTGKPEAIALYKQYADLRMNLLPYIYDQAVHSSRSGEPMMRAMSVQFPEDQSCLDLTDQYMFGDSLLVAPVLEEGSTRKRVYVPEGSWISFFGNEVIDGSRLVTVQAELAQIPVFQKQDTAIALNLDASYRLCSHVGNRVDAYQRLSFMVYLLDKLDYRFEDDLGNRVQIKASKQDGRSDIRIMLDSGDLVTVIFRNVNHVRNLSLNGLALVVPAANLQTLSEGQYILEQGDLYVRLAGSLSHLMIEEKLNQAGEMTRGKHE